MWLKEKRKKMKIDLIPSPNKTNGRSGWIPDIIVNHITEGTYSGSVSWLCNPASNASTHFVVARDGRIACLVDIQDTAWGNGTTISNDNRSNQNSNLQAVRGRNVNANLYTISIEHEGKLAEMNGGLTKEQLDASIWLHNFIISEVKRLFGKTIPIDRNHIVGHCDVTPKWKPNCPGAEFPFEKILDKLNNFSSDAPSGWATEAWSWGVKNKITDGTNPQGIPTREQTIAMLYNYNNFSLKDSI
jgi:N-acetyl-anhydromuramyl-L-alanine amidase AmpD